MIDKIDSVVNAIGGFLYQPYIVPLFLIVAGLYFTIRTGLIQFRLFGESIHVVAEKPKEKGSISSFGALMVSTASRVGTGNIVGVSTAICLGGFGAVFWMWRCSAERAPSSSLRLRRSIRKRTARAAASAARRITWSRRCTSAGSASFSPSCSS